MGKNKLAKFAEMETFPHVLQYPFARLQQEPFPLKGRWREDFFHNDHPIVLELGCGKGEYTVGLGELYPEKNFIGVDVKGARIWTGAKASHEAGMTNVAFLRGEIESLTSFFAPGEVDEIWITFPDPQMKKVTKRLTSSRFIRRYLEVLRPGGSIHLKTDSPEIIPDKEDLYDGAFEDKILGIKTYYERQWLSRGLTIKYLHFIPREPEAGYVEPDIEIEPDSYRSFSRSRRVQ